MYRAGETMVVDDVSLRLGRICSGRFQPDWLGMHGFPPSLDKVNARVRTKSGSVGLEQNEVVVELGHELLLRGSRQTSQGAFS